MADHVAQDRRQEIIDSVAAGDDGFLFHRDDCAFEQLCGAFTLSDRQTERWASMIETRHAWCRVRGIGHYMLVVPEKHVVYADKLPPGFAISPDRPVQKIMAALDADVRADFLYPEDTLRTGRAVEDTYYRTDVHWTQYGAFLAYSRLSQAMRSRIDLEPIPEAELLRRTRQMVGDLGMRLDSEPNEEAVVISHPRARLHPMLLGSLAFKAGQAELYESNAPSRQPRAVLFRDSNATPWLPFLCAHFSRLAVVASSRMFYDLIRSERPDVVIMEVTERYLARPWPHGSADAIVFPEELRDDDFASFTGVTLPLPTVSNDIVIEFGAEGNSRSYIGAGWAGTEPTHTWMTGTESSLSLPAPAGQRDYLLNMLVGPCIVPGHNTSQKLDISVNRTVVGSFDVTDHMTIQCRVPKECFEGLPMMHFEFRHPDFVRPSDFGGSDPRELAISAHTLRLRAD